MSDQPTKVTRYKAVVPSDHTILGTHFDGSRGYVIIYFNKTQLCPREPSEWVPATDYDAEHAARVEAERKNKLLLAERDETETDIGQCQDEIYAEAVRVAVRHGHHDYEIDGGGSDEEWVEFSLAEFQQALGIVEDKLTEAERERDELRADLEESNNTISTLGFGRAKDRITELEGALREVLKAVRDGRGDATNTYMKVDDWANKYAALTGEQEDSDQQDNILDGGVG